MIDQKMIAEKAGVSRATVSRAFTQNANISPKTLAKIQQAMLDLGIPPIEHFPNKISKNLKYALIIAGDISNNFYAHVIRGISDRLISLGILPVICNSNYDEMLEERMIEQADANNYLGIFFVTAMERSSLSSLLRRINTPVIFVNRYIHSFEGHTVCIDNFKGGHIAAQHLIANGHHRIAYIATYKGSTAQEDRIRGFKSYLDELPTSQYTYQLFYTENSLKRGTEFAINLIRQRLPYTALFVADCETAAAIVHALTNEGYQIPRDISILCFDDSLYISDNGLRLSTIAHDPYSMGETAAKLLTQQLAIKTQNTIHIDLQPQLIIRSSVQELPTPL